MAFFAHPFVPIGRMKLGRSVDMADVAAQARQRKRLRPYLHPVHSPWSNENKQQGPEMEGCAFG